MLRKLLRGWWWNALVSPRGAAARPGDPPLWASQGPSFTLNSGAGSDAGRSQVGGECISKGGWVFGMDLKEIKCYLPARRNREPS